MIKSTKRPVDTEASEPVAKKVCTGSNGHSCGSEAHKIGDVDSKQAMEFMENRWKEDIEKNLCDYIAIPNQSPMFDPECLTNGYQDQAMDLIVNWVKKQNVEGLNLKVYVEPNRTPLLFIEIEATDKKTQDTTLMYGHMDKQPPLAELWDEGLGPWKPVIRGDKLYGRGGADDGYSVFAAISAIQVLKSQNLPHGRVVITIEACEESGSKDLPYYMEKLQDVIGTPSLIICLDSGCGNYDQMWLTCSLRGLLVTRLKVSVLAQGCHSGTGSGIVPSSFRILRELLDRIEDSKTGKVLLDEAYVKVPEIHAQYAKETAESLGSNLTSAFTMPKGMRTTSDDLGECVLNRCWKPQISYTGIDGVPAIKDAGNVLRTHTTVNLSIRLPPTLDPAPLMKKLEEVLTTDTPYGAKVELECPKAGVGWMAPPMKKWLSDAVNEVSQQYWGKPVRCWGEGGSIPFMGMMGRAFPDCLFVITGLLGPGSNAHGPNEYMHIPNFKRLSAGMATLLLSQYKEARNPTSPPQSPGTTKPCYAPAPFSDRCCE